LYTASDHDGRIWRVDSGGQVTEFFHRPALWAERGIRPGAGGDPFTLDAEGNIYCVDRPGGTRILRITPAGDVGLYAGALPEAPTPGAPRFGSLHFSSMAWGPDGLLYVTDEAAVWRIRPDGTGERLSLGAMHLRRAAGIAVDHRGHVFVADYAGGGVLEITPDGGARPGPGVNRARLHRPVGLALGPSGELYVTDFPAGAMHVWRITPDRAERIYSRREPGAWTPPLVITAVAVLLILYAWRREPANALDWAAGFAVVAGMIGLLWWAARLTPFLEYARHVLAIAVLAAGFDSYRRLAARRGAP
jgi:sugar lactone lactonase YvrE